jgi:hypothetical protein
MTKLASTARVAPAKSATAKAKANAPVQQSKAPASAPATPIEIARANVSKKLESGVGVTLHTNGNFIKGLSAEPVVARPQRKMLRVIDKIIGHPGKGNCIKRFHLYKEGMTLLDCKVTEGLIPSDVTFYAELGYLTLRDATDAEYDAAVKAWEQGKGKGKAEATDQAKVA